MKSVSRRFGDSLCFHHQRLMSTPDEGRIGSLRIDGNYISSHASDRQGSLRLLAMKACRVVLAGHVPMVEQ